METPNSFFWEGLPAPNLPGGSAPRAPQVSRLYPWRESWNGAQGIEDPWNFSGRVIKP